MAVQCEQDLCCVCALHTYKFLFVHWVWLGDVHKVTFFYIAADKKTIGFLGLKLISLGKWLLQEF